MKSSGSLMIIARKTEEVGAELRQKLSEAGFEVRAGVVVSV